MFQIICMGIGYEHEPDFVIDRREGYPHYLALLVRTKCRLRCGDEIRSYPPGTFVLYDMNTPQYYAADDAPYVDDWIQFASEPKVIRSFGLPLNEPITIPEWAHPEQYFSLICLPRETARQKPSEPVINIRPEVHVTLDTDGFGNMKLYGAVFEPHDSFSIKINGKVRTCGSPPRTPSPKSTTAPSGIRSRGSTTRSTGRSLRQRV